MPGVREADRSRVVRFAPRLVVPEPTDRPDDAAHQTAGPGRLFLLALGFCLAGAAALGLDCPLARWFADGNGPWFLRGVASQMEVFGRAESVVVALLLVYCLDPARRRMLPWVLCCPLASGLTADLVKMLVLRVRPANFDLAASVWTSFGGWLPWASAGSVGQSFPSGHTAVAAGLAVALCRLYPKGRGVFVLLAVLVAYQRVDAGAHFPSDVLCGAAVACFTSGLCLWIGQRFLPRTVALA